MRLFCFERYSRTNQRTGIDVNRTHHCHLRPILGERNLDSIYKRHRRISPRQLQRRVILPFAIRRVRFDFILILMMQIIARHGRAAIHPFANAVADGRVRGRAGAGNRGGL